LSFGAEHPEIRELLAVEEELPAFGFFLGGKGVDLRREKREGK
jgi:hypothetical protein